MPSLKNLVVAAAVIAAPLALAKTVTVTATEDNTFDPSSVKAAEGDTVEFRFEKGNHSVVAGNYDWPCSPMQLGSGFFSGFVHTDDGTADDVFRVQINNTDPIPFYSSVGQQCPDGMVGLINPSDKTNLDGYRQRASKLSSGVTPSRDGVPFGGRLVDDDDDDDDDDNDNNDNGGSSSSNDDNDNDDDNDGSNGSAAGSFKVSAIGLAAAVGVALVMS